MVCEDGTLIEEWSLEGGDYSDYTDTEPTEWSCYGSCCHGAISVAECLGQPCDTPDGYGTSDSRGAYSSEIQKS